MEIKKYGWKDLSKNIEKINPELADIINQISPDDSYGLYDIRYEYGENIINDRNQFLLPSKGTKSYQPLTTDHFSASLVEDLNYNFDTHPVGLVLSGSLELLSKHQDKIGMFSIITSGNIFGTWRILDRGLSHCPICQSWNLTSGSRSAFMLSKIGVSRNHQRLSKYLGEQIRLPKSNFEHGDIFKTIYDKCHKQKWESRIIFFGKKWFDSLDDPAFIGFKSYLLDKAWNGSGFWRNQLIWDIIFSNSSSIQTLKPDTKMISLVKNLLSIGAGAIPGFVPAVDDSNAPISLITDIYQNIYRFDHKPVLMHPSYFNLQDKNSLPVYSSLQYPCAINLFPSQTIKISTIKDMEQLEIIISSFAQDVRNLTTKEKKTSFETLLNEVNFSYFHSDKNPFDKVQLNTIMAEDDKRFGNLEGFPTHSHFIRGCVRVAHD